MRNRFEDLWKAAEDGASAPLGPLAARTGAEIDLLMNAWYQERHTSIELEILLTESRQTIARLLSKGSDQPEGRKKARRLLREIDRTIRSSKSEEE